MKRVLHIAALGAGLLLAACGTSNDESRRVAGLVLDQTLADLGLADEAAPAAQPGYDEVVQLPFASVALRIDRLSAPQDPPALLAANAAGGGRVWYLDAARRGVAFAGGRMVGTRGMAQDLLGAPLDPADPLAVPRPLAEWPAGAKLLQRSRDGQGEEHVRAFSCRYAVVGPQQVTLYEISERLTLVEERCANVRGGFVNRHWIEPETGQVWRTRQWLGPETGVLDVAVIRPFG